MQSSEFTLTARDGKQLHARSWKATAETVGAVVVVHGLGEHAGRYAMVARQFAEAGYFVFAYDQRGHGKTRGQRGYVRSYNLLLDDIEAAVAEAGDRAANVPLFLYGHSLGGNLVLNYALRRQPTLNGLVVTSPLLRPTTPLPSWKHLCSRVFNRLWPRMPLHVGFDPRMLSRDPSSVRAYLEDPSVHRRVACRLVTQALEAGEWAQEHALRLQLPLLLIHGSADALTSHEATRDFARAAGSVCQLRIWDGGYHEPHWDIERELVIQCILDWLKTAQNPLPEGRS